MIYYLRIVFGSILISMLIATTWASLDRGIMVALGDLWPDAWFRATLLDAYLGFITVFVWIAYKEQTLAARTLWFVLLMGLGNIAIALYVLLQLRSLRPGDPVERLLLRQAS